jgi:hypothetical protein
MNILQYFTKKIGLPPFRRGDKVKLKCEADLIDLIPLYNKHNENCPMTSGMMIESRKDLVRSLGDDGIHIVSKVEEGIPAAGGWFVYVNGINTGYHGNIFELIKG